MKKKIICLGAVLATALFCSTAALAAETITTVGGSAAGDVKARYEMKAQAETVYKVDVTWGSMEFIYQVGGTQKTWNPVTHEYVSTQEEPKWLCAEGQNKITLTNYSNAKLTAAISTTINPDYSEISAAPEASSLTLEDASKDVGTEAAGKAATAETIITLSGNLTKTDASKTPIGSVKVTIADAAE